MKTYSLKDKDTLVYSVNGEPWQTITFEAKDFQEIGAATAEELAAVLHAGGLVSGVNEQGLLVLSTETAGGHTSLEVDLRTSTAAPALGLGASQSSAQGTGLRAARLVSLEAEPFALPLQSEMVLLIDGHRRRVVFDEGITEHNATAAEVARVINAKRKKVADVGREGNVILTSNSIGAGSRLEVEPAPADKTDAAAILGFTGAAALDEPHRVEPARLVCGGQQAGLEVVNLTASPVELHLAAGVLVLPGRSSAALASVDAANSQLQRLIEQGFIRLGSAP